MVEKMSGMIEIILGIVLATVSFVVILAIILTMKKRKQKLIDKIYSER